MVEEVVAMPERAKSTGLLLLIQFDARLGKIAGAAMAPVNLAMALRGAGMCAGPGGLG